jgi:hypothetical protein
MTTTTQNLIDETKRYLLSGHREQMNSLNGAVNSSTTSINFDFNMGSLGAQSIISVDLELMYVWSADLPGRTAIVQRGYLGSTAASHADGALVTVNPRFPDFSIFKAINAELADLSGIGMFQPVVSTFTFVAGKEGYDLGVPATSDVIDGLDARYDYPGIRRDWPRLVLWEITTDSNLTDFPSGFAVILTDLAFPGRDVRITYSAPFNPLSAITDDVLAVSGLPTTAHDIPPLGAAIRLQGSREAQRNFNESQSDTRRAAEVPVGAQITATRVWSDLRMARIKNEVKRLNKTYPHKRKVL